MQAGRSLIRAAAAAALVSAAAPAAHAQIIRGIHSCSVAATTVAFGTVAPPIPASTTGAIVLTCDGAGNNNRFQVSLSQGLSGVYSERTMRQGPLALAYNLYLDAARTQIWGDGSGGSRSFTGDIDSGGLGRDGGTEIVPLTVFAQLPSQGAPPNGDYADMIVVTVSF